MKRRKAELAVKASRMGRADNFGRMGLFFKHAHRFIPINV